jgi:hypothetical protein
MIASSPNLTIPTSPTYLNYFSQYRILRSTINLPLKLKLFFTLLEDIHLKNSNSTISKDQIKKYKFLITVYKKQS